MKHILTSVTLIISLVAQLGAPLTAFANYADAPDRSTINASIGIPTVEVTNGSPPNGVTNYPILPDANGTLQNDADGFSYMHLDPTKDAKFNSTTYGPYADGISGVYLEYGLKSCDETAPLLYPDYPCVSDPLEDKILNVYRDSNVLLNIKKNGYVNVDNTLSTCHEQVGPENVDDITTATTGNNFCFSPNAVDFPQVAPEYLHLADETEFMGIGMLYDENTNTNYQLGDASNVNTLVYDHAIATDIDSTTAITAGHNGRGYPVVNGNVGLASEDDGTSPGQTNQNDQNLKAGDRFRVMMYAHNAHDNGKGLGMDHLINIDKLRIDWDTVGTEITFDGNIVNDGYYPNTMDKVHAQLDNTNLSIRPLDTIGSTPFDVYMDARILDTMEDTASVNNLTYTDPDLAGSVTQLQQGLQYHWMSGFNQDGSPLAPVSAYDTDEASFVEVDFPSDVSLEVHPSEGGIVVFFFDFEVVDKEIEVTKEISGIYNTVPTEVGAINLFPGQANVLPGQYVEYTVNVTSDEPYSFESIIELSGHIQGDSNAFFAEGYFDYVGHEIVAGQQFLSQSAPGAIEIFAGGVAPSGNPIEAPAEIKFYYQVSTDFVYDVEQDDICNSVSVISDGFGQVSNEACFQIADFELAKTALNNQSVALGEEYTFLVQLQNTGQAIIDTVVLNENFDGTLPLPTDTVVDMLFDPATGLTAYTELDGGVIVPIAAADIAIANPTNIGDATYDFTFSNVNMGPGDMLNMYVTVTINDQLDISALTNGVLTNFVTAQTDATGLDNPGTRPTEGPVKDSDADIIITEPTAGTAVALEKTITNTGPYQVGDTIAYEVVFTNEGPADVILNGFQDTLPSHLTYTDAPSGLQGALNGAVLAQSPGAIYVPGTGVLSGAIPAVTLSSGDFYTFTYYAVLNTNTHDATLGWQACEVLLDNVAMVTYNTDQTIEDSVELTNCVEPTFTVEKTLDEGRSELVPGGVAVYDITFTFDGIDADHITNVSFTDTFPVVGIQFSDVSIDGGASASLEVLEEAPITTITWDGVVGTTYKIAIQLPTDEALPEPELCNDIEAVIRIDDLIESEVDAIQDIPTGEPGTTVLVTNIVNGENCSPVEIPGYTMDKYIQSIESAGIITTLNNDPTNATNENDGQGLSLDVLADGSLVGAPGYTVAPSDVITYQIDLVRDSGTFGITVTDNYDFDRLTTPVVFNDNGLDITGTCDVSVNGTIICPDYTGTFLQIELTVNPALFNGLVTTPAEHLQNAAYTVSIYEAAAGNPGQNDNVSIIAIDPEVSCPAVVEKSIRTINGAGYLDYLGDYANVVGPGDVVEYLIDVSQIGDDCDPTQLYTIVDTFNNAVLTPVDPQTNANVVIAGATATLTGVPAGNYYLQFDVQNVDPVAQLDLGDVVLNTVDLYDVDQTPGTDTPIDSDTVETPYSEHTVNKSVVSISGDTNNPYAGIGDIDGLNTGSVDDALVGDTVVYSILIEAAPGTNQLGPVVIVDEFNPFELFNFQVVGNNPYFTCVELTGTITCTPKQDGSYASIGSTVELFFSFEVAADTAQDGTTNAVDTYEVDATTNLTAVIDDNNISTLAGNFSDLDLVVINILEAPIEPEFDFNKLIEGIYTDEAATSPSLNQASLSGGEYVKFEITVTQTEGTGDTIDIQDFFSEEEWNFVDAYITSGVVQGSSVSYTFNQPLFFGGVGNNDVITVILQAEENLPDGVLKNTASSPYGNYNTTEDPTVDDEVDTNGPTSFDVETIPYVGAPVLTEPTVEITKTRIDRDTREEIFDPVQIGETVYFQIEIVVTDPDGSLDYDLVIADVLGAGFIDFDIVNPTLSVLPDITTEGTYTYIVSAQVDVNASGTICNVANIADRADTQLDEDNACVYVNTAPPIDAVFEFDKAIEGIYANEALSLVGSSPLTGGEYVAFEIDVTEVTNTGLGTTIVDDYDPALWTFVSSVPSPTTTDTTNGVLTYEDVADSEVTPGSGFTETITVVLQAAENLVGVTELSNAAVSVEGPFNGVDNVDGTDDEVGTGGPVYYDVETIPYQGVVIVPGEPSIEITKERTDALGGPLANTAVNPGDTLYYTLTITIDDPNNEVYDPVTGDIYDTGLNGGFIDGSWQYTDFFGGQVPANIINQTASFQGIDPTTGIATVLVTIELPAAQDFDYSVLVGGTDVCNSASTAVVYFAEDEPLNFGQLGDVTNADVCTPVALPYYDIDKYITQITRADGTVVTLTDVNNNGDDTGQHVQYNGGAGYWVQPGDVITYGIDIERFPAGAQFPVEVADVFGPVDGVTASATTLNFAATDTTQTLTLAVATDFFTNQDYPYENTELLENTATGTAGSLTDADQVEEDSVSILIIDPASEGVPVIEKEVTSINGVPYTGQSVGPYDEVTYTITTSTTGDEPQVIDVYDTFDADIFAFVSASSGGTQAPVGTVSWIGVTTGIDLSITLSASGNIDGNTTELINEAFANYTDEDGVSQSTDPVEAEVPYAEHQVDKVIISAGGTVYNPPVGNEGEGSDDGSDNGLSILDSAGQPLANPDTTTAVLSAGDIVHYQLQFASTNGNAMGPVRFTDAYDAGSLTFSNVSGAICSTPTSPTLNCNLPNTLGATHTVDVYFTVNGDVDADVTVLNTVTSFEVDEDENDVNEPVNGPSADTYSDTDTVQIITTVDPVEPIEVIEPIVEIIKTRVDANENESFSPVYPGDDIMYQIEVIVTDPQSIMEYPFNVTDVLELDFVSQVVGPFTVDGPGPTTFDFTATVRDDIAFTDALEERACNEATAAYQYEIDENGTLSGIQTETSNEVCTPILEPSYTLTKTLTGDSNIVAFDENGNATLTYDIDIERMPAGNLFPVTVTDDSFAGMAGVTLATTTTGCVAPANELTCSSFAGSAVTVTATVTADTFFSTEETYKELCNTATATAQYGADQTAEACAFLVNPANPGGAIVTKEIASINGIAYTGQPVVLGPYDVVEYTLTATMTDPNSESVTVNIVDTFDADLFQDANANAGNDGAENFILMLNTGTPSPAVSLFLRVANLDANQNPEICNTFIATYIDENGNAQPAGEGDVCLPYNRVEIDKTIQIIEGELGPWGGGLQIDEDASNNPVATAQTGDLIVYQIEVSGENANNAMGPVGVDDFFVQTGAVNINPNNFYSSDVFTCAPNPNLSTLLECGVSPEILSIPNPSYITIYAELTDTVNSIFCNAVGVGEKDDDPQNAYTAEDDVCVNVEQPGITWDKAVEGVYDENPLVSIAPTPLAGALTGGEYVAFTITASTPAGANAGDTLTITDHFDTEAWTFVGLQSPDGSITTVDAGNDGILTLDLDTTEGTQVYTIILQAKEYLTADQLLPDGNGGYEICNDAFETTNDVDSACVPYTPNTSGFIFDKTLSPGQLEQLGDITPGTTTVSYDLVFTNTGTTPLTSVIVSDAIDFSHFAYVSAHSIDPVTQEASPFDPMEIGSYIWNLPTVEAGETYIIRLVLMVQPDAVLYETSFEDNCAIGLNNSASAVANGEVQYAEQFVTGNCQNAAVLFTKNAQSPAAGTVVELGEEITYMVTLTNSVDSNDVVTFAKVEDVLDPSLEFVRGADTEVFNTDPFTGVQTLLTTFGSNVQEEFALQPGASLQQLFTVRVRDLPAGGQICNVLSDAFAMDDDNADAGAMSTGQVCHNTETPELIISKYLADGYTEGQDVVAGSTLDFYLEVTNPGSYDLENVQISEVLSNAFVYDGVYTTENADEAEIMHLTDSQTITAYFAQLDAGETERVKITVTVQDIDVNPVTGVCNVITGANGSGQYIVDGYTVNANVTLGQNIGDDYIELIDGFCVVPISYDFTLTKETDSTIVAVGETVTHTITLTNTSPNGEAITNPTISDVELAHYNFESAVVYLVHADGTQTPLFSTTSPITTPTDDAYIFTYSGAAGILQINESLVMELTTTVTAAAYDLDRDETGAIILPNAATGTVTEITDPETDDDVVTLNEVAYEVTKESNPLPGTPVVIGQTIDYTITVDNLSSTTTLTNVTITDELLPGLTYTDITGDDIDFDATTNTLTLNFAPPIGPLGSGSMTFPVTVTAGAALSTDGPENGYCTVDGQTETYDAYAWNALSEEDAAGLITAMATGAGVDTTFEYGPTTVTGTPCHPVLTPSFTVEKELATLDENAQVNVGDYVEYAFTIENTGTADLTDITFEDILSDSFSFIADDSDETSGDAYTTAIGTEIPYDFTLTTPALTAGETLTYAVMVEVLEVPYDDNGDAMQVCNVAANVPTLTATAGTDVAVIGAYAETDTDAFGFCVTPVEPGDENPNITLIKDSEPAPGTTVAKGSVITYYLTVENPLTTRPLTAVTVEDELPNYVTYIEVAEDNEDACVFTDDLDETSTIITAALGDIAAGESVTCAFTVRVNTTTPNGTILRNDFVAYSTETEPATSNEVTHVIPTPSTGGGGGGGSGAPTFIPGGGGGNPVAPVPPTPEPVICELKPVCPACLQTDTLNIRKEVQDTSGAWFTMDENETNADLRQPAIVPHNADVNYRVQFDLGLKDAHQPNENDSTYDVRSAAIYFYDVPVTAESGGLWDRTISESVMYNGYSAPAENWIDTTSGANQYIVYLRDEDIQTLNNLDDLSIQVDYQMKAALNGNYADMAKGVTNVAFAVAHIEYTNGDGYTIPLGQNPETCDEYVTTDRDLAEELASMISVATTEGAEVSEESFGTLGSKAQVHIVRPYVAGENGATVAVEAGNTDTEKLFGTAIDTAYIAADYQEAVTYSNDTEAYADTTETGQAETDNALEAYHEYINSIGQDITAGDYTPMNAAFGTAQFATVSGTGMYFHDGDLAVGGEYTFDMPTTIVVEEGDLDFTEDFYLSDESEPVAFVVQGGNVYIAGDIQDIHASIIITNPQGRLMAAEESTSDEQLLVLGLLIAEDPSHLFARRVYIGENPTGGDADAETGSVEPSVLIAYDAALSVSPPPGLTTLLGDSWWQQ